MTESPGRESTSKVIDGEQVIYVRSYDDNGNEVINLSDVILVLWNGRNLGLIMILFAVIVSTSYSLLATERYRAEVLLAPASDDSSQMLPSRLSGLSSLIGISGAGLGGSDTVEALAVLQSRDFTRSFIEERNLLPVLYPDEWDASSQSWKLDDGDEPPDIRDAIEKFEKSIRRVSENEANGLVTVSVEWTDPEIAADWTMSLVERLNNYLRQRALREAERNVAFLQAEIESTSLTTLKESMGGLLETELQKLMLAKGNEQYAFRIVDRAQVPKRRSSPKRVLIVFSSTVLAAFLAVLVILIRNAMTRHKESPSGST